MRRLKEPRGIRGRNHDHRCGGGGGEELDLVLGLMLDWMLDLMLDWTLDWMLDMLDILDMLDMLLDLTLDMLDGRRRWRGWDDG